MDDTNLPSELDRRGENRAASLWVRTALTEQSNKIDKLSEKVDVLHETLIKSMPDGNIKEHHDIHQILSKREDVIEARKKFWRGFWDDILKKALTAAIIVMAGVFALGSQLKLKELIFDAPSTAEVKK